MLRKIVVFLVYIFNLVVFRVEKNGEENIKEKGAYLICANHRSKLGCTNIGIKFKKKSICNGKSRII